MHVMCDMIYMKNHVIGGVSDILYYCRTKILRMVCWHMDACNNVALFESKRGSKKLSVGFAQVFESKLA